MSETAEPITARMNAPSALDLNPRPPRTVRVSKRVAGLLIAVGAVVLGLFAYAGYKRQQRQVAAFAEANTPRSVAPATAAGAEIAKEVPSGNVPNLPAQRPASVDAGVLQPPTDVQCASNGHPGQRRTRLRLLFGKRHLCLSRLRRWCRKRTSRRPKSED